MTGLSVWAPWMMAAWESLLLILFCLCLAKFVKLLNIFCFCCLLWICKHLDVRRDLKVVAGEEGYLSGYNDMIEFAEVISNVPYYNCTELRVQI